MHAPAVQYVKTTDGYNLAFSVQGEGDPWVIVPPGFHHLHVALEEEEVAAWVRGLSERFQLIRYDARGQGLSTRDLPANHSTDDSVLDLEAILDRLNPGPVILHGIGSSAHVAVRFAARNPQRVRALVLVNASLTSAPWPRALMDLVAQEDWEIFLSTMTGRHRSPTEARLSKERLRQMVTQQDFLKKFHAHQASDMTELCPQVQTPALVLHLREIEGVPLQQSAELAAQIPEARLSEIGGGLPPWLWGDFNSAIPAIEDFLSSIPAGTGPARSAAPANLSPREAEVLHLVAAGKSNQQIADVLVISVNTVNRHVSNIFDKIGVANRAQATAYAKDHGLA